MPRRSRVESEDAVPLFPFLAVLLCTMGTLALVFVFIAQKATNAQGDDVQEEANSAEFDVDAALGDVAQYGAIVSADELAGALNGGNGDPRPQPDDAYAQALVKTGAATLEDVLNEKESLEWFLEELEEIQSRSSETFEEERLRLANAEAGVAKLREEAEIARQRHEALLQENDSKNEAEALKKRVATLDQEIEKLQEEAKELRDKNANVKKSYAIVPYQGKKGTFRRPIYVECKASGVSIEPEGVKFDDRDFLLAQYPGNPFDAALRAAAQRYLATGGQKTATGEAIEPYPLIIVRPSGARFFYAAVAALASWGELYGYEFVEEDQTLEYPPADPVLASRAQEQAARARERMQVHLAAATSLRNAQIVSEERARRNARRQSGGYGDEPKSELQSRLGANVRLGAANPMANVHAGPSGVARQEVNNVASSPSASSQGGGAPSVVASAPFGGMNAFRLGGVFTGAANNAVAPAATGQGIGDDQIPAVPYTGRYAQDVGGASVKSSDVAEQRGVEGVEGDASASLAQSDEGDKTANAQAPSSSATRYVGNTASASQGSLVSASDNTAPRFMKDFLASPSGSRNDDASSGRDLSKTLGNTTYAAGATGSSDSGERADAEPGTSSESDSASNTTANPFNKTVELNAPPERRPELREESETPPEAFLVSRELTRSATRGNERGIVVRCTAREYVFPKQPGLRSTYSAPYSQEGKTRQDRDAELADLVALCVKSWGVAGRNMYWAPYIKAEVSSGGETGFQELQEFCAAQGMTLVRTTTSNEAPSKR